MVVTRTPSKRVRPVNLASDDRQLPLEERLALAVVQFARKNGFGYRINFEKGDDNITYELRRGRSGGSSTLMSLDLVDKGAGILLHNVTNSDQIYREFCKFLDEKGIKHSEY